MGAIGVGLLVWVSLRVLDKLTKPSDNRGDL